MGVGGDLKRLKLGAGDLRRSKLFAHFVVISDLAAVNPDSG